jgi:uncharacterized membrane protein
MAIHLTGRRLWLVAALLLSITLNLVLLGAVAAFFVTGENKPSSVSLNRPMSLLQSDEQLRQAFRVETRQIRDELRQQREALREARRSAREMLAAPGANHGSLSDTLADIRHRGNVLQERVHEALVNAYQKNQLNSEN